MSARRSVRIALVAYRDDGNVLQLVPLGTIAQPLPIATLLEHVRQRVAGASIAHVLTFDTDRDGTAPTKEAQ